MLQVAVLSMRISDLIYMYFLLRPIVLHNLSISQFLLRPIVLHDLLISQFLIKPPYYYSFKDTYYGVYQLYKRVASNENLYGVCKWSYNMKIPCLNQVVVPVSHICACVSCTIFSVSWV